MSINLDELNLNYTVEEFFNPDYKLEFIADKYENFKQDSIQQIINVFKRIGSIETQKDKDLAFFTGDDFQEMFEMNKWVFAGTVINKQSIIREYMRWYRKKRLPDWEKCDIPNSIAKIENKKLSSRHVFESDYFKSLNELQSDIDVACDAFEGVDDSSLNLYIAMIYLAWYDVDSDEAIEVKKSNVSMTADQIYLPVSERFIEVDSKQMEFIREFSQQEGYDIAKKNGETGFRQYKETQYLLRTSQYAQLTQKLMREKLSIFSDLFEESGMLGRFKYDKIQKSSVFLKLIEYEKKNGELTTKDVAIFEKYFRDVFSEKPSKKSKFYGLLKDFKKFKEYYYSSNSY